MLIYVLDRDYSTMKEIDSIISANPKHSVKCFTDVPLLRNAIAEKAPDSLLLDAEMRNTITFAQELVHQNTSVKIVLMAKTDEYAEEAFAIGAVGYILKPVNEEKINRQLFQMKHPLLSKLK